MKIIKKVLMGLVVLMFSVMSLVVFPTKNTFALDDPACSIDSTNPGCESGGNIFDTYESIMNAVLMFVGAIAIIVIIVAGVMITTSAGDPGKVKKAKSAIVYALIGLVVTLAAWGIANFIIRNI